VAFAFPWVLTVNIFWSMTAVSEAQEVANQGNQKKRWIAQLFNFKKSVTHPVQYKNGAQRSNILRRPDRPSLEPPSVEQVTPYNYDQFEPLLLPKIEAPFGFTGESGILPMKTQQDSHFAPMEDRWRTGFPVWDRYSKGHPWLDDYPGVEGHWWDPYNQNVLKGDYPIVGQHTFLNITATSLSLFEYREVPTATTPFESTFNPFEEEFFGDPRQFFLTQFYKVRFDLFHGNQAAFKPLDWQIRLTPVFNMNYLDVGELAIVNPDVRHGTTRFRDDVALEEWFVEAKLADLSPNYDFMSVRAGSQFFTSDFRGFIFSDTNRAIRLFGTRFSNRDQFNVIWFDQQEKETNSQLNTMDDRDQNIVVVNYYRQDFLFPGYTAQASFHYNLDRPGFKFDKNDFLIRPDPAGVFQPHSVETYYFGIAGDGHIRRINVSNQFYWVTGRDSLNPIGGRELDINATMAAIELSYDRDWARFRTSFFWASGDDDANDDKGEGFDSIFDNPNFAGGEFSYWQRQAIQLFGIRLVNDRSIIPDLRSSKSQGQSNFTNPGLFLFNIGFDADITPKLKVITNANYLYFDKTEILETFTFQDKIDPEIGIDLNLGVEYRPFHNDNMIVLVGFAALLPGDGFKDLYNEFNDTSEAMHAGFLEVFLTY